MSWWEPCIDLPALALSLCSALVSPWLWFDIRFTRQFPVYYCCVQVVPDKINQCLWIIAGEHSRHRSVAISRIARQNSSVPWWYEQHARKCPRPLIQDCCDDVTFLFWDYLRFLDWAHWCDDPWSVEEAVLYQRWGKRSPAPNPISTKRLKITC